MPYARIEIASGRNPAEKRALLATVDAAFVATLGLPPNDAFLRLFEFTPENTMLPRHHGPRFTFVEIQLFPGRDTSTKTALYRTLTDNFAALGVPPADLVIALLEIPRPEWSVAGKAM
jgi:phenylpyruvate tautomerase PptA (4-oxalocrotonate tautomerase family)